MYKETPYEQRAKETVHKMVITMKKHRKLFDEMRKETGLGRSDHRMLMLLSEKGSSLSQTSIAQTLEISTAAVAVMLKKMESDGYILRKVNEADSRFNEIILTEKGEKIAESSKKAFLKIDTALFEGFSLEETEKLNELLDRLQLNISNIERG